VRLAYNPRPMSNRSRRDAFSRAEARRRARLLERGEAPPDEEAEDGDATTAGRPAPGGFLSRLFPPAPPLPNRPDPLANLRYTGPLRSAVAGAYLLANHPRGWLLPAIPWAVAQALATLVPQTLTAVQIPTVLVSVFAVIAAGWIGWERPWLFGLAATVAGTLIEGIFFALLPTAPGTQANPLGVVLGVVAFQVVQLQWILGAFIGWYGGYLRRRMAMTAPQPDRGRRRR
jgi:hypothetical protein